MIPRRQRPITLTGITTAALLASPLCCRAAEAEPLDADAVYGALDVAGGHLFNAVLYLPTGLLTGAILLEIFAQWKRNRDIEPGILFLLFSAAGAAAACALFAYAFSPAGFEAARIKTYVMWMAAVAGLAAVTFFLKRTARDQRLFSFRPLPELAGRVTPARYSGQKLLLLGYRALLGVAWVISLAGLSVMPLTHAPAKPLGQALRSTVDHVAPLFAFGSKKAPETREGAEPGGAEKGGVDAAEAGTAAADGSRPAPQLAELIAASIANAPAPGHPSATPAPEPPSVAEAASALEAPPAMAQTEATPPPETPPSSVAASATVPALAPAARGPVPKLDRNFFATRIKPILDSKCASCHGAKSTKGNLRLDGIANVRAGVKGQPVVVGGDLELSSLYQRLITPDDEDLMPPRDKGGPLPPAMIQAVKAWIQAGADYGDGVSAATKPVLTAQPGGRIEEELSKKLPPPPEALLLRLTEAGGVVRPLSANGALLDLNLSHLEGGPDLAALAPIAKNIHTLDLTRTRLSDDALTPLAAMTHLTRLDLKRNPTLGDGALVHLKNLAHLEYLNLYGTKVGDAGLEHLAGLKKLRNLYLFETECTADGADRLRAALPQVVINLGQ